MKAWKYHRGEWAEIEESLDWRDEESLEEALKRSGYDDQPLVRYGSDFHSVCADLYSSEQRGAPPYLIAFSLCDTVERVHIDDLPSLMQWLRDYAMIFHLPESLCLQRDILTLLGRAFRAWHGHDFESVCPFCDPYEHERRKAWREEWKRRKEK